MKRELNLSTCKLREEKLTSQVDKKKQADMQKERMTGRGLTCPERGCRGQRGVDNEYFTMNPNSFNMMKSFYAIQNNLNNKFFVILEKQGDATQFDEFAKYIPQGNYDVRTLLKILQDICFGLINVGYDRKLDKFL